MRGRALLKEGQASETTMRVGDGPIATAGLRALKLGIGALSITALACNDAQTPADSSEPTPTPPPVSCSASPVSGSPALKADLVATSLEDPLDLQAAGDRSRVFVAERRGRIRLVRNGTLVDTPFLDISDRVLSEVTREQGFLGFTFHPRFAENGRFFVNYTSRAGETHIAEFKAAAGADTVDPATERTVLVAEQPFASHCGGQLRFGPDGFLYIALGDGGSAGDPMGYAQSVESLLGKILRIDVDAATTPYAIPGNNPFLSNPNARREIWAMGLRNPWRFAFDGLTGDMYIGDVGQRDVEEIEVGLASRHGGENYGWAVTEGRECFPPGTTNCSSAGFELPVVQYTHAEGCAVTGGVVYRGCRMPGYAGTYFYGDFCSGFVRSFRFEGGRAVDERDWTAALGQRKTLTSFGTDAEGEVYMIELGGNVYKIGPAS